jgi:hypothetical protein
MRPMDHLTRDRARPHRRSRAADPGRVGSAGSSTPATPGKRTLTEVLDPAPGPAPVQLSVAEPRPWTASTPAVTPATARAHGLVQFSPGGVIQLRRGQRDAAPPNDGELAALLERIDREGLSREELDRIVGARRRADAPEAIVAAETETASRGEMTNRAISQMQQHRIDNVEAFRRAARRRQQGETRGTDAVHTQSPEARQTDYTHRWGLVFLMPVGGGEVVTQAPFQRSLRGSTTAPPRTLRNPTADRMVSTLRSTIRAMAEQLQHDQVGELVVNIQAHGDDGGVVGARGSRLSRQQMIQIGEDAAARGIHVVYIIDACDVGAMVGDAQRARVEQAQVEGAGLPDGPGTPMWALSNPGRQLVAAATRNRVLLRSLHTLVAHPRAGEHLGETPDGGAYDGRRAIRRMEEPAAQIREAARALLAHNVHVAEANRVLQQLTFAEMDRGVIAATSTSGDVSQRGERVVIGSTAHMLDAVNDLVSALVRDVDAQVNQRQRGAAQGGAAAAPAPDAVRQVQGKGGLDGPDVLAVAERGVQGRGAPLPHLERIQAAFGRHDVSGVRAHLDGAAAAASTELGARAFASGNDVAFGETPSLFLAAHEAAHVVQQRGGVQLAGGVGAEGDGHERHADAVAERVVRGESVEELLDAYAGARQGSGAAVQRFTDAERRRRQAAQPWDEQTIDGPLAEVDESVEPAIRANQALGFSQRNLEIVRAALGLPRRPALIERRFVQAVRRVQLGGAVIRTRMAGDDEAGRRPREVRGTQDGGGVLDQQTVMRLDLAASVSRRARPSYNAPPWSRYSEAEVNDIRAHLAGPLGIGESDLSATAGRGGRVRVEVNARFLERAAAWQLWQYRTSANVELGKLGARELSDLGVGVPVPQRGRRGDAPAAEGAAAEGAAAEGAAAEGAAAEGAAAEGAARDGAAREGAARDGAAREGAATEGAASEETAPAAREGGSAENAQPSSDGEAPAAERPVEERRDQVRGAIRRLRRALGQWRTAHRAARDAGDEAGQIAANQQLAATLQTLRTEVTALDLPRTDFTGSQTYERPNVQGQFMLRELNYIVDPAVRPPRTAAQRQATEAEASTPLERRTAEEARDELDREDVVVGDAPLRSTRWDGRVAGAEATPEEIAERGGANAQQLEQLRDSMAAHHADLRDANRARSDEARTAALRDLAGEPYARDPGWRPPGRGDDQLRRGRDWRPESSRPDLLNAGTIAGMDANERQRLATAWQRWLQARLGELGTGQRGEISRNRGYSTHDLARSGNERAVEVDLHRTGVTICNNRGNPLRTSGMRLDPQFAEAMVRFIRRIQSLGVSELWTAGFLRSPISPADTHPRGQACDITGFMIGGELIHLRSGRPMDPPAEGDTAALARYNDVRSGHSDWFDHTGQINGTTHERIMHAITNIMRSHFSAIVGPGNDAQHNGHWHVELSSTGRTGPQVRAQLRDRDQPESVTDSADRRSPEWRTPEERASFPDE